MMMITSEKAQTFPPNLRNVWTNKIPRGRVRLEGPASCVRQVRIRPFTRRLLPPHSTSTDQGSLTASHEWLTSAHQVPRGAARGFRIPFVVLCGFLAHANLRLWHHTLLPPNPPPPFGTVAAISSTALTLRTQIRNVYRVYPGVGL